MGVRFVPGGRELDVPTIDCEDPEGAWVPQTSDQDEAMTDDRHGRHRRQATDRRRRPADGFRALRPGRFERLVVAAIESLPELLLGYLDNVQIIVDDVPPIDVPGIGEAVLLGLYEGVPRTERGFDPLLLPDRITLFRRPIEARARTMAELTKVVQDTVVHEIAHHFGIDDDRLGELGWG